MEFNDLKLVAKEIRKHILSMLSDAGSGHPGGSLSAVELVVGLYFDQMKYNPKNPQDPNRDFFILSKGHACPVLYAVIHEIGCIKEEELCTLRKVGSRLQGHPAKDRGLPGIEVSTGSLGYGLSIGVGSALGFKKQNLPNRVYVLMGDGEQQEGSIWEAAMAAPHFKLDNLCAIVDNNSLQIDGKTNEIMKIEPLAEKYRAFGWHTIEIDGHDFAQVISAYKEAKNTVGKPTVIIAKTVKGKGVSFMENVADWHGKAPSKEQLQKAFLELQ